jgi:FAD/FMN-containing dehydrogenase
VGFRGCPPSRFGDTGSVGVAGITLGGGVGWLVRKHGMTIDRLLAVEIVTADGRRRIAGAVEEPDLFWGVRGAGANLGVRAPASGRWRRVTRPRSAGAIGLSCFGSSRRTRRSTAPPPSRPGPQPSAPTCRRPAPRPTSNFMGAEDADAVRGAYPAPAYARLRELKRRFDPDNVFRANHNVRPR